MSKAQLVQPMDKAASSKERQVRIDAAINTDVLIDLGEHAIGHHIDVEIDEDPDLQASGVFCGGAIRNLPAMPRQLAADS